MGTNKEIIQEIVNESIWETGPGESRCTECLAYRYMGKHEKNCRYAQILQIIEETEWDKNGN